MDNFEEEHVEQVPFEIVVDAPQKKSKVKEAKDDFKYLELLDMYKKLLRFSEARLNKLISLKSNQGQWMAELEEFKKFIDQ